VNKYFSLYFIFAAEYIKQCQADDPKLVDCLKGSINHLRPYLAKGKKSNYSSLSQWFSWSTLINLGARVHFLHAAMYRRRYSGDRAASSGALPDGRAVSLAVHWTQRLQDYPERPRDLRRHKLHFAEDQVYF
jgi:hypothetical protein